MGSVIKGAALADRARELSRELRRRVDGEQLVGGQHDVVASVVLGMLQDGKICLPEDVIHAQVQPPPVDGPLPRATVHVVAHDQGGLYMPDHVEVRVDGDPIAELFVGKATWEGVARQPLELKLTVLDGTIDVEGDEVAMP